MNLNQHRNDTFGWLGSTKYEKYEKRETSHVMQVYETNFFILQFIFLFVIRRINAESYGECYRGVSVGLN